MTALISIIIVIIAGFLFLALTIASVLRDVFDEKTGIKPR